MPSVDIVWDYTSLALSAGLALGPAWECLEAVASVFGRVATRRVLSTAPLPSLPLGVQFVRVGTTKQREVGGARWSVLLQGCP